MFEDYFRMTWPPFIWLMVMGTIVVPVLHYQKRQKKSIQSKQHSKRKNDSDSSTITNASETSLNEENSRHRADRSPSRDLRRRKPEMRDAKTDSNTLARLNPAKMCVNVISQQTLVKTVHHEQHHTLETAEAVQVSRVFKDPETSASHPTSSFAPYSEEEEERSSNLYTDYLSVSKDTEDPPHSIFRASSDTINYSIYEVEQQSKSKDELSITDNPLFIDPFHDVDSISTADRCSSPILIQQVNSEVRSCDRAVQTSTDEYDLEDLTAEKEKPKPLSMFMDLSYQDDQTATTVATSSENLAINLDMILNDDHLAFSKPPPTRLGGAATRSFSFQSESGDATKDHSLVNTAELSEAATPKLYQSPERNLHLLPYEAPPHPPLYHSPATHNNRRRQSSASDLSEIDSHDDSSSSHHYQQLEGLTIVKPSILSDKKFIDPPLPSSSSMATTTTAAGAGAGGIAFDSSLSGMPANSSQYLPYHRVSPEESRLLLDSWTSLLLSSPPPQSLPNSRRNSNTSSITNHSNSCKEVLFDQLQRLFPTAVTEISDREKRSSPESASATTEKDRDRERRLLAYVPRAVKASPLGNLQLQPPASAEKPSMIASFPALLVEVTPTSVDSSITTSITTTEPQRLATPPPATRLELVEEDERVDREEVAVDPSHATTTLRVARQASPPIPPPLLPNTEVITLPSTEKHLPHSTTSDRSLSPLGGASSHHTVYSHSSASSSNATTRTKRSSVSQRSALTANTQSKLERATGSYVQQIDHFIRTRQDFYSPGYYYNVQKLFEALPPPKELKISTAKDFRGFLKKHPHSFKLSSDQKAVELLALTPLLVLNSASSGDEEMLSRYLTPSVDGLPIRQSLLLAESTDNATVSTLSAPLYLYGYFHCVSKYCHKRWNSRSAMSNTAQTCPRCHVRVYPYQLRPLQPEDKDYNDSEDEDNINKAKATRSTAAVARKKSKSPESRKTSLTKDGTKSRGKTTNKKIADEKEYEGEGEEEDLTIESRKRGISVEGYFDYPHDLQLER